LKGIQGYSSRLR